MAACVPVTFALVARPPVAAADADATAPPVVQAIEEPEFTIVGPSKAPLAAEMDTQNSSSTLSIIDAQAERAALETVHTTPAAFVPDASEARPLTRFAPFAAAAYLFGVAFMLARLALALCGGQRLRKSATPVDDLSILLIVRQQARRIGLSVAPLVCYCERVTVPVVVGVLRPTILLPASLVSGLAPDQLEALITHELSRIRRFDLVANLVQRLIESLLFFHPAVWYVSRRVSAERENCCDDLVVLAGCDRVHYAGTLIRVAEVYSALGAKISSIEQGAVAASGSGQTEFKRRILRLINSEPGVHLAGTGPTLTVLTLFALLLVSVAVPHWAFTLEAHEEADQSPQRNDGEDERQDVPATDFFPNASNAVDLYGDSLPAGAFLRLGTLRFKGGGHIAWSPSGKLLASAGQRSVRIMDAVTGRHLGEVKSDDMSEGATAIAFSHDGRYIAVGRENGVTQVYTVPDLKEVFSGRHRGERIYVRDVAFSPSGVLASATWEGGEVVLWDITTGAQIHVLAQASDQRSHELKLAFSPNGKLLACSCDNSIRIWRLGEQPEFTYIPQAHEGKVGQLAFAPDGKVIASAGYAFGTPDTPPQSQLRLWDAETGRPRGELYEEIDTYFAGLAIRDNGRTLITATRSQVLLFDLENESLRHSVEINGPPLGGPSEWATVSPDGKTIAYAPRGGKVRLLDLESGESPIPIRPSHEAMMRAAA